MRVEKQSTESKMAILFVYKDIYVYIHQQMLTPKTYKIYWNKLIRMERGF